MLRGVAQKVYGAINLVVANMTKVWIPPQVTLGEDFHIIHAEGSLSIHPDVVIGNRVGVMHNVTIGTNMGPGAPVIGDDVFIGVNSTVLGPIRIGDRVRIAANTAVTTNVPSDSIVVGSPGQDLPAADAVRRRGQIQPPRPRAVCKVPATLRGTAVNALTTTFYELLSDNLAVRPAKQALVDADRSATYAELAAEVDRIAGYLPAQGIAAGRPGHRPPAQGHRRGGGHVRRRQGRRGRGQREHPVDGRAAQLRRGRLRRAAADRRAPRAPGRWCAGASVLGLARPGGGHSAGPAASTVWDWRPRSAPASRSRGSTPSSR